MSNGFFIFTLHEFCQRAIRELEKVERGNFASVFVAYRYDLMGRMFPHEVFGTNRTTEFFEDTLRYLNNPRELKEALKEATENKQTYEIRYLKWVLSHSRVELSTEYATQQ
jgi:hypothetical protein